MQDPSFPLFVYRRYGSTRTTITLRHIGQPKRAGAHGIYQLSLNHVENGDRGEYRYRKA